MAFPFFFESLIYLIPFVVFSVFSGNPKNIENRPVSSRYWICFLIFWFIYCGGYMTGSDTIPYENFYENAGGYFDVYEKEPGFYAYIKLFRFLGIGYFPFLIFTKSLCLFSFFQFAKRNSDSPINALFITLALQGPFLYVNCPLRALIAISIITFFYRENQLSRTIIGIVIASMFHFTAIVLLLLFIPLYKVPVPRWIFLGIYAVCFLGAIFPTYTISLFQQCGFGSYFDRKIEGYAIGGNESGLMRPGTFFNLAVFFVLYVHYKFFRSSNQKVWAFSVFYLAFYWLSLAIPMVARYMLYFVPFLGIAIAKIGLETPFFPKKIFQKGFQVACLTFLLLTVNNFWAYVPYSNYWVHLISGDLKSFEYRKAYNKNSWGILD